MEDMKVPPGWVRLTLIEDSETGPYDIRASAIASYGECYHRGVLIGSRLVVSAVTRALDNGCFVGAFDVTESPAEVARLIAEAEAAERRDRALPVMAAILFRGDGITMTAAEYTLYANVAARVAAAILDAIDARGEGE